MYHVISNILNETFKSNATYQKVSYYLKRAAQEHNPLKKQKFLNLAKQWRMRASTPRGFIR